MNNFLIKIELTLKDKSKKSINNIYVPEAPNRQKVLNKIYKDIKTSETNIFMGTGIRIKRFSQNFRQKNIKNFYAKNNTKGTRCVKWKETDRIIDFAISNKSGVILAEKSLKN